MLSWAKSSGTRLNIEINHYPTEPSFDPSDKFVTAELDAIDNSGIPKSQVLLQSFLPDNLTPAKARGYTTALITFTGAKQAGALAREVGRLRGARAAVAASPRRRIREARARGRPQGDPVHDRQGRATCVAARAAGVDGVITDDPPLARRTLRCDDADARWSRGAEALATARKALKRAKRARRRSSGAAKARKAPSGRLSRKRRKRARPQRLWLSAARTRCSRASRAGAATTRASTCARRTRREPLGVWIRHTVHKPPGGDATGSVWFTLFEAGRARGVEGDGRAPTGCPCPRRLHPDRRQRDRAGPRGGQRAAASSSRRRGT